MTRVFEQTYRSSTFKSLVYIKKSMKEILAQRTSILKKIDIHPSPKSSINLKHQADIVEIILTLFKQHPVNLFDHQLLVIQQKNWYYVFFSCDDTFIPVCKRCFRSVYFTFLDKQLRILCTNVGCKQSLLETMEILGESKDLDQLKQSREMETGRRSKSRSKIRLEEEDLERIKRASQNILK